MNTDSNNGTGKGCEDPLLSLEHFKTTNMKNPCDRVSYFRTEPILLSDIATGGNFHVFTIFITPCEHNI